MKIERLARARGLKNSREHGARSLAEVAVRRQFRTQIGQRFPVRNAFSGWSLARPRAEVPAEKQSVISVACATQALVWLVWCSKNATCGDHTGRMKAKHCFCLTVHSAGLDLHLPR